MKSVLLPFGLPLRRVSGYFLLFLSLIISETSHAAQLKPRIIVLTDISPNSTEPDDKESMIRLLAHVDLYEIEGLIATTGWSNSGYAAPWIDSIFSTINAYEKDLPNLRKRSNQTGYLSDESKQELGYWPSADYLRSRTKMGSKKQGYSYIGANNNSLGSDLIIQITDENDDRPVWVTVWGGANTLAQAIWRVQQERTAEQLKTFLHKIRVYTITDQDMPQNSTDYSFSSHYWMRKQFEKDLLFIWDECAWRFQNSTGVNRWSEYAADIQGHGNLGGLYPKYKYGVEGDTPSFLHLMFIALNDPDLPTQGGWGGYFTWARCKDAQTYAYTNYQGTSAYDTSTVYQNHFYRAIFNNFAARMDWAKDGAGNRNPVVIVNQDSSVAVLTIKPLQGASVTIDASSSHDPDGNSLAFKWWTMPAAGTYTQAITIANANSNHVTVNVPNNSAGKNFHVICEVTDNGTPNLTAYRRIIVEPTDKTSIVKSPRQGILQRNNADVNTKYYDCKGRLFVTIGHCNSNGGVVLRRFNQNRDKLLLRLQ